MSGKGFETFRRQIALFFNVDFAAKKSCELNEIETFKWIPFSVDDSKAGFLFQLLSVDLAKL